MTSLTAESVTDDKPTCSIREGADDWHDGAGWYWMDDDYPEDSGYVGAFATEQDCIEHARRCGYDTSKRNATATPHSDESKEMSK